MAGTAEVKILISAADKASGTLKNIQGEVNKLGSAFKVVGAMGATAMVAAGAAFLAFGKEAAKEQVGIARLQQSLKNLDAAHRGNAGAVEEVITARQKLGYSDDELRDSLSMLVAQTSDYDDALRRQSIAMDLARGTGLDLQTASRLLGKATEENVQTLRRYGITLKEGTTLTEMLAEVQRRFGGQAGEFAETAAGKWAILTTQIDNVKEAIGTALLPVATEVFGKLARYLEEHQDDVQKFADALAGDIARAAETAGRAFNALMEFIGPFIRGLGEIRKSTTALIITLTSLAVTIAALKWGTAVTSILAWVRAFGLLRVAALGLQMSLGPIGLTLAAIGAAAAIFMVGKRAEQAAAKQAQAREEAKQYVASLKEVAEVEAKQSGRESETAVVLAVAKDYEHLRFQVEMLASAEAEAAKRRAASYGGWTKEGRERMRDLGETLQWLAKEHEDAAGKFAEVKKELAGWSLEQITIAIHEQAFSVEEAARMWPKYAEAVRTGKAAAVSADVSIKELTDGFNEQVKGVTRVSDALGELTSDLERIAGQQTVEEAALDAASAAIQEKIASLELLNATYGKLTPIEEAELGRLESQKDVLGKAGDAIDATKNKQLAFAAAQLAGLPTMAQVQAEMAGMQSQAVTLGGQILTTAGSAGVFTGAVGGMQGAINSFNVGPMMSKLDTLMVKAAQVANAILGLFNIQIGYEAKKAAPLTEMFRQQKQLAQQKQETEDWINELLKRVPSGGFGDGGGGGGGGAGAAADAMNALEDGIVDLTEATAGSISVLDAARGELLTTVKELSDSTWRSQVELLKLTNVMGTQGLLGHANVLIHAMTTLKEGFRQAGESVTQFLARLANAAYNQVQSALDALFNRPTRETAGMQLRVAQLERQRLMRKSAGASDESLKRLDAQIEAARNSLQLREKENEILRLEATLKDRTLLTERQMLDQYGVLVGALGVVSQTAADLNTRLSWEAFYIDNASQALVRFITSLDNASGAVGTTPAQPFQKGGIGNFGRGTLAMLHGREAVIPLDKIGALGGVIQNDNRQVHVQMHVTGTGDEMLRKVEATLNRALRRAGFGGSVVTQGAYAPS